MSLSLPLPLPVRPTSIYTCHHGVATAKTRRRPPPSSILVHPLPSRSLYFLSRPPISSGRHRAAALQPSLWPTEAFVSDHLLRPIDILLLPDHGLTSLAFPKFTFSLLAARFFWPSPYCRTAATAVAEAFVSDHLPRPINVLLLPDHGLTLSAFPKCNSSSPGRNFFCPPPPLWLAGFFISNHCPRPIVVVLFPDHGLPSPVKCNSSTSSPCWPPLLLLVTAAVAVAGLILPLRSLSPTHPRPPPPGP